MVAAQKTTQETIYLVDKPGAVQSVIRIGALAPAYDTTGDFFRAQLVNFNLGGNFNSRINQNLREDKAYTYGASSSFIGFENYGAFNAQAEVDARVTGEALKELLYEITLMRDEGVTSDELNYLKQSYLQGEALSYVTPEQKSYLLLNLMRYGTDAGYLAQQSRIIEAMTPDELSQVAKMVLKPEQLQIVVVGDKATLLPQLEKLELPIKGLPL